MSRVSDQLSELLAPVVTGLGYELIGIEWDSDSRGHRVMRIYIDAEDGITVDDCERVSNQVSALLDVEDPVSGSYLLEVSSPGIDRPLFTLDHFRRFVDQAVKLRLRQPRDGQRRFKGVIAGTEDDCLILRTDGGDEIALPIDNIDKARLVPDYKAILKG
ncbi:ribosome maturation factor RimP [Methylohalobius crimeensis]|uniref:ribosome maturation factor RimP n=1 Tax=Methylohalobius crimeensis TaxID=244365 RepID=UPI000423808C|nr:ribosome maturation factor RimP [Methylohalobius crimeensis]